MLRGGLVKLSGNGTESWKLWHSLCRGTQISADVFVAELMDLSLKIEGRESKGQKSSHAQSKVILSLKTIKNSSCSHQREQSLHSRSGRHRLGLRMDERRDQGQQWWRRKPTGEGAARPWSTEMSMARRNSGETEQAFVECSKNCHIESFDLWVLEG